jgi:hypothetical protein
MDLCFERSVKNKIYETDMTCLVTNNYSKLLQNDSPNCDHEEISKTIAFEYLHLLVDEETGHTLSGTDAHARQEDLLLLSPCLTQSGNDLPGASGTKRMTQSNSATTNVHLGVVNLECVQAVNCHGCKSLVQFNDVNVVNLEVELAEKLGDGDGWANTHDAWCKTSDRRADELGEDGLAEGLCHAALHENDCSSAIGDLAGIASVAAVTVGKESGFDLAERLVRGSPPWTLVFGENDSLLLASLWVLDDGGDWDNLVVKPAFLLRDLSSPVAFVRVSVLHFTCDVEVLTNVLAGLAHGLHAVFGFLVRENLIDKGTVQTVTAISHGLGTDGNTAGDATHANSVGDVLCGLETRRAEAVAGVGSGGVWETGSKCCGADVVGSLCVGDLVLLVQVLFVNTEGF